MATVSVPARSGTDLGFEGDVSRWLLIVATSASRDFLLCPGVAFGNGFEGRWLEVDWFEGMVQRKSTEMKCL